MEKLFGWLPAKFDWILLASVLSLTALGFSTLQSTVLAGGEPAQLLQNQFLAFALGLILLLLISGLDYRYFYYLAPLFYLGALIVLLLLLFLGVHIRGTVRWFDLGFLKLQPSEIVKPFLLVALAAFLARISGRVKDLFVVAGFCLLLFFPLLLIFRQPDLGTVIVLGFTALLLLFISPINFKMFVLTFLFLVIISPLGWQMLAPYQKTRLVAFLNPQADPLGSGYNVIQSQIAVGSGQIFGRGWGRGTQSHLRFLPEQHTDFIFATYTEETGFIGALTLLLLFAVLVWRGLLITFNAPDTFGKLLAFGVVSLLVFQTVINIGMNLGLFPITGIPLPLVSYGGSSMLSSLILLGILESIAMHS